MSQQNNGRGGAYRAALAAVIILGVLLVAGVVALVFGFMRQYGIYRGGARGALGATANSETVAAPAVIALEPGARIISVKTDANHLVLQLATAKGDEVEVLELATGKLLYRVAAQP